MPPVADDSFGTGWAIEVDAGLGRLSLSFRPTPDGAALAVRAISSYYDVAVSDMLAQQRTKIFADRELQSYFTS